MKLLIASLLFLGLSLSASAQSPICPVGVEHCGQINWTPPTTGDPATGYNIYRSLVSGGCTPQTAATCTKIASPAQPPFLDSPLLPATTYYYVLTSTNAGGESAPTSQAFGTTGAVTLPGVPGNFTIQVK